MKAMLLAAGLGTRLRPLTRRCAKPVIWFMGKPLAVHLLEMLHRAGVEEVCVNLHYTPRLVQRLLLENVPDGMRLSFHFEPDILGTGGALAAFRKRLSDEPFYLLNGDILIDIDLNALRDRHFDASASATCVLHPPSVSMGYPAVGAGTGDKIVSFPSVYSTGETPVWEGTFAGVHVISPEIFDYIKKDTYQCIIRDVYARMMGDGRLLQAYRHSGYWSDLGTPERYWQAHRDVLDGRIRLEAPGMDQRLKQYIARDVQIGRHVHLGSYVVIGERSHIGDHVHLDNTIVWPKLHVPTGSHLKDGIVFGKNAVLSVTSEGGYDR